MEVVLVVLGVMGVGMLLGPRLLRKRSRRGARKATKRWSGAARQRAAPARATGESISYVALRAERTAPAVRPGAGTAAGAPRARGGWGAGTLDEQTDELYDDWDDDLAWEDEPEPGATDPAEADRPGNGAALTGAERPAPADLDRPAGQPSAADPDRPDQPANDTAPASADRPASDDAALAGAAVAANGAAPADTDLPGADRPAPADEPPPLDPDWAGDAPQDAPGDARRSSLGDVLATGRGTAAARGARAAAAARRTRAGEGFGSRPPGFRPRGETRRGGPLKSPVALVAIYAAVGIGVIVLAVSLLSGGSGDKGGDGKRAAATSTPQAKAPAGPTAAERERAAERAREQAVAFQSDLKRNARSERRATDAAVDDARAAARREARKARAERRRRAAQRRRRAAAGRSSRSTPAQAAPRSSGQGTAPPAAASPPRQTEPAPAQRQGGGGKKKRPCEFCIG